MSFLRRLIYGIVLAAVFFALALLVGIAAHKPVAALSLIGTSIVLETQPAAAASLPLRFHPLSGAFISLLGNMIAIPLLMLTFQELFDRFTWFKRKLQKAEKWSRRYERFGVWVFIPLCPVFGAYVCIGIGYVMRWNPRLVLCSVVIGMVWSTFVITYGGTSLIHWIRPYL